MSDPLFFFSYARADRRGADVIRLNAHDGGMYNSVDIFYDQLCKQVAAITGKSADEVGFFDNQNLELGAPWPVKLIDALRSASVLIALFSPTYFLRPACGREFEIFRQRHEALNANLGRVADYRILPILWVRRDYIEKSIPTCCQPYIRALQQTAPRMPEDYPMYGLMRMFELQKLADSRAEVCHRIADRICALKDDEPLPELGHLDFDAVNSAFHETPAPGTARPVNRNKREMRVYYLVPTRTEWSNASGMGNDEFGDQREKARLFTEAPGATIGSATAEGVATVKPDLGVTHEALPNDFAGALAKTDDTMTTPLVVFDRRAVKVPALRAAAGSYAVHNFENTGFVTVAGGDVSDSEIDAVFRAKKGALPQLHNWTVPTARNEYVGNVASIVNALEAQLISRQTEKLTQSGEPIPGLSGPGTI
jgi:hypothetical protein